MNDNNDKKEDVLAMMRELDIQEAKAGNDVIDTTEEIKETLKEIEGHLRKLREHGSYIMAAFWGGVGVSIVYLIKSFYN